MAKTAFLFSGQGAQYVGMGKELYDNFKEGRDVFEEASKACGLELYKLCAYGPKELLDQTEYTQPAILTVSLAALRILEREGVKCEVAAGLSLGEYSALTASSVFSVATAAALVRKRGRFMQEAVPEGLGAMAAVLMLSEDKVRQACAMAQEIGYVEPANFNCPGQIVIGGEKEAVEKAAEYAKQLGALKVLFLPVSAPFHTKMLEPASKKLQEELQKISFHELEIPVICNVTADYIKSEKEIADLLRRQIMSPVLWEQSIRHMIADGVERVIEIGPGTTLSGLVKKVDRKLATDHVENMESLIKTLERK